MSRTNEFKSWGAPNGPSRVEVPDGVTRMDGDFPRNNLQDTSSAPMQQSGDMQTRIVHYPPARPPMTE